MAGIIATVADEVGREAISVEVAGGAEAATVLVEFAGSLHAGQPVAAPHVIAARLVDQGNWRTLSKQLWQYFDEYGPEGVAFNVKFAFLNQYVSHERKAEIVSTKIPYPPDGNLIVLLSSDGFSDMVTSAEIQTVIREEGFEVGLDLLYHCALERGKMVLEGTRPILTMRNGKPMAAHALYPDHITLVGRKFSRQNIPRAPLG